MTGLPPPSSLTADAAVSPFRRRETLEGEREREKLGNILRICGKETCAHPTRHTPFLVGV